MENLTSLTLFPSLVVIFIGIIVWKISTRHRLAMKPRLPPGPRKLPLIGNLHLFVGSIPHHRLRDLATTYGSVMHLQLGEVSTVVISSAEAAKSVMKFLDINFAQRPSTLAASLVFYNMKDITFAPYGEYWRQLRKICVLELLSVRRVQSYSSVREDEVSDLIKTIYSEAGLPINFSQMIFRLTNSITSRAAFGKRCKDQEAFVRFVSEIVQVFEGFSLSDAFPSMKFIPLITGFKSRLVRLSNEADRLLENIITDHRTSRKITKDSPYDEEEDLLDVLLRLQEPGDLEFTLTTDNIKAVILDLFIAGSETSSTTIVWAMSELVKNPEVMKRAQTEVRKVYGSRANVDESGLDELKYVRLIIKETLRLHPPIPLLLPRESKEICELHGYDIPAKTKVMVNVYAMGRDPRYWTEPEKFYPERFIDSSVGYKGTDFEYIPFGAGRRMCPGISFGLASVELPLAKLLYHFDWKLPGGQKLESLDMTEAFGAAVRRKLALHLVPVPINPPIPFNSM